jgi:hypothetical protein
MLRLLQIDGKVDGEKASSSSHYLRPRAKESASHGNSFAIFIVADVEDWSTQQSLIAEKY